MPSLLQILVSLLDKLPGDGFKTYAISVVSFVASCVYGFLTFDVFGALQGIAVSVLAITGRHALQKSTDQTMYVATLMESLYSKALPKDAVTTAEDSSEEHF